MNVVGEGARAAGGGSGGFIHAVAGLGSSSSVFSSPLFFWLLTVALVAAIHIASGLISSSHSRSEDEDTEKKSRRGGFAAGDEAADGKDDRILEMMRSFSFVHASEEGFVEGIATYDCVVDGIAHKPVVAPPQPPAVSSSLSFSFQYQVPEIPREADVISREIPVEAEKEKEPSIPSGTAAKDEHKDIGEEAEEVLEEEEQSRGVVGAAPKIVSATHNYRFLTERDFRGFVEEPEAMTVRVQESFVPSPAQPEERIVVDAASRRGGFATADEFRPANKKPGSRDRVASAEKRTPLQSRKQASSPSDASKVSAVSGGTSFASEFSGFGDSDSESSASDGYSVKELAVDSDSDWFLSEQDFPAAVHDAASLRSYKAKVLKAMESLEEADTLERSFQDSATTVSPGSVGQASPDSTRDGSVKYPEDMWSRSPSPEAEYKEDDEKGAGLAEESYERNMEDDCSVDMSDDDDELSSGSKKMAVAPVYAADSAAEKILEHSEKQTMIINDHTDEAISDSKGSPDEELTASSHQAAVHDTKRSPEPSGREFVGLNDHSPEVISAHREESASTNDQSAASVYGDKRSPEHSEIAFIGTDSHSHELISDVWKEIVGTEEEKAGEVAYDDKKRCEHSDIKLASTNDHSNELTSDDRKAITSTNDQSHAVASEFNNTLEHSEKDFSTNDHSYGVIVPAGKNISEPTADEHSSADAPRRVHFSVTEKAKALDGEGEDQQGKWEDLTEEEEDELESLWEHQDLIEQLKLELKKVRSVGLPTILEESESPKAPVEDLKPWRIDAKFLREDPMDELNKFYKSYRERMRKFDILCYQKMYAIDFLQLRGSKQSSNSLKTLSPTVTSILSHNFRSSRRRSPEDPSERFLKELRYDLETVYVGQMCLSWEFLRWQYEQARDLPESDPYHSHQYNRVAGEFQQFQVVVQRFVEDESFKGPRLPNYINNRCVLRNLLQVPVVKEDSPNDRMEDQRKGNYVITSEELEEVMEESMRILWEFIKADRAETTTPVLKGFSGAHVELQDPLDHDLMTRIHATLLKKEKRLKDLLRTGNCIVKKFKKPKENRSNQNLFFSQVDMRLVARVLRMPRITSDQLQWCKAKLDKIILVDNRKIHREASFLLFPC